MFSMGWRKDKYSSKDEPYLHRATPYPDSYSLEQYLPDVRDQNGVGACVGFGIGGVLTGVSNQQSVFTEWFSPNWIYNGARFIEGSLTEDAGAYPRDAYDWLLKKGCLLESLWPFMDKLDTQSPPSRFDVEAAKAPLINYYRVVDSIDGICSAISAGNLVSIGTPWFETWMSPGAGGVLPVINSRSHIVGGHETFLYGYDKSAKVFFGQNSWGQSWGKSGRYVMPMASIEVFKARGGYDAHYVAVNWAKPNPPEPPEPPTPPEPPDPSLYRRIQLRESIDSGQTWRVIYEG